MNNGRRCSAHKICDIIVLEEAFLEERFGTEYLNYKKTVRRYF